MIVFVDYEHNKAHSKPWGEKMLAARTWITYRLEDLSGQHCMLVRYDRISVELLEQLGATAICISGNSADPRDYDPAAVAALTGIVQDRRLPMFGFCGGFQFIASALGADVVPLGPTDQPPSHASPYPEGTKHEFGYFAVERTAEHPVLEGLEAPIVRHAHALHVPAAPDGFEVLASTDITPIQMAVDDTHKIVGTQFHPEYWTDEHPAGRIMISNFFEWIS